MMEKCFLFLIFFCSVKIVLPIGLFPSATVVQVSMCVASPIELPNNENLAIGRIGLNVCMQVNYDLPYRLVDFYNPIYWPNTWTGRSFKNATMNFLNSIIPHTPTTMARSFHDNLYNQTSIKMSKRDLSAGEVYNNLQNLFEEYGYHKNCLLKSVCELAKSPLARDDDDDHQDLIYDVIHFMLTPSTHQAFDLNERQQRMIYEEAEQIGREQGDCELRYTGCRDSPLHHMTHSLQQLNEENF